jgi:hypothetical protein
VTRESREALTYILDEMTQRLARVHGQRDQLAGELKTVDAEIAEIARRAQAIRADLAG